MVQQMWAVFDCDHNGRRGKVVGVYDSRAVAENAAKGKGWYGDDADVAPAYCLREGDIVYYETYDKRHKGIIPLNVDYPALVKRMAAQLEEQRKVALNSLTHAQRQALGL